MPLLLRKTAPSPSIDELALKTRVDVRETNDTSDIVLDAVRRPKSARQVRTRPNPHPHPRPSEKKPRARSEGGIGSVEEIDQDAAHQLELEMELLSKGGFLRKVFMRTKNNVLVARQRKNQVRSKSEDGKHTVTLEPV